MKERVEKMKANIMILNVMNYDKKDGNGKGTRIGFIFTGKDTFSRDGRVIGYPEQSIFYDGVNVFDKVPIDFICKPIVATLEEVNNPRYPLRSLKTITSIELNGQVVNLL